MSDAPSPVLPEPMTPSAPPPQPEFSHLDQPPRQRRSGWWMALSLFVVLVLPLLIGGVASYFAIPRPAVGIIRLNTDIYYLSALLINMEIDEARLDPAIRAVVVQIDSPGGEVAPTQAIYMELLKLRGEMPVVGSIDSMAASGGFYAAMATEPLYAKPSSTVGNVGVWGYFPSSIGVNDVILASGPFKLSASNSDEFLREIEGIKQEFIGTVQISRGDRMVIRIEDLSQGLAYPGREAYELGLVDALGSQSEAIEKAADMAGIANYEIIDLETRAIEKLLASEDTLYLNGQELKAWTGSADPLTGKRLLGPGIYLLYDLQLGGAR